MLTLRRIAPWCFALALIVYLRPYTGIRHDATLYLAQALRLISPDIFSRDLFFVAGSQASFTLFPQLLALLLAHVEPGKAFLALTLVSRLFFYAASAWCVHVLFPARWRWHALLALIVMPTGYGAFSMFSYAEPFLTARPLAEALCLLAVATLVRDRLVWSVGLFAAAGLLHPLQAIAAVLVALCWLVLGDRRWLWSLLLVVPVLVLAALKVGPLAGLLLVMDTQWRSMIDGVGDQVFLGTWTPRDWCIVLADVYLLSLLARWSGPSTVLGRLAKAVLLATVLGLGLSFLLADVLRLILPIGLQLWRVLWMVHWLAAASIPFLVWDQWQRGGRQWIAPLLVVTIAVIGASVPRSTLPWAVLGLIPLHMVWPHVVDRVSPPIRRLLLAGLSVAMIMATARYQLQMWAVYEMTGRNPEVVRHDVMIFAYPLICGGLVALAVWGYRSSMSKGQALMGLLSLFALVGALSVWDSRSPWSRVQESAYGSAVFSEDIPRDASVFWFASDASPRAAWLILRRASYYSPQQLSGQMFNRQTALLGRELSAQVEPVTLQAEICEVMANVQVDAEPCRISESGLEHLCTRHGDLLPPDYFVLPFDQEEHVHSRWQVRHPRTGEVITTEYLYKCSDWVSPPVGTHA
ncbi:hypothetical protein FHT12_001140 [Xanthomonas campestris]|uniref:hypothetical protein n=1 Tax=Xanthomonas euroxanthea TaxID=2259622 RepID=UPI000CEEFF97|nr:hypothetical protein [Xanthomonas euroxanthea]NIJ92482.1 hypothetical protein [Xanthomonas euroxanthea]PPT31062.1 hypothetical protein XaCFBP7622_10995 [Xanthomonas arboricola]